MKDVSSLYLGWDNPRQLIKVGPDVLVLRDGDRSEVLQGEEAAEALRFHTTIVHHLCGIQRSTKVEDFMEGIGPDRHRVNLYNKFFDEVWPA